MNGKLVASLLTLGVLLIGLASFQYKLGPFDANMQNVLLKENLSDSTGAADSVSAETTGTQAKSISVTPGVERWYTNPELQFSFRLPDGFSAPDIITDHVGTYGVLVRNKDDKPLVVYAYPMATGTELVAQNIHTYFPRAVTKNVMGKLINSTVPGFEFEFEDATRGGKGVAFMMVYEGYRYEISTTLENRNLFDFIINSWRFAPPTPPALPK